MQSHGRGAHPRAAAAGLRGWSGRAVLLLWILAVALAVNLAVRSVRWVGRPSNAFVAQYTAARLLVEGGGAERFYDNEWFEAQVARFEPGVRDVFRANPPTMGLLLLPLAWADYRTARGVWIVAGLLLIIGTAAWLTRNERLYGVWAPGFLCVVLLAHPVFENLSHGQAYGLAFALLTLAWQGHRTSTHWLLGVPIGLLLITKTAALLLWPLLLLQRRWRALVWGTATAAGLAFASLPLTGVAAWRRYPTDVAQLPSEPLLAVTAYQTLIGFFRHLFGPGGAPVGESVIHAPWLAAFLTFASAAALLGASVPAAVSGRSSACAFSAFVLLGLILSPVSSEAHYVMALLPLALLLTELCARRTPRGATALLLIGAFLLAAPVPFRSPRLGNGFTALLAYPRLYGALLLWGLAVAWSRRRTDTRDAAPVVS